MSFWKWKTVLKTKKEQTCCYCEKTIPAASTCTYLSFIDEEMYVGKLTTGHVCSDCRDPKQNDDYQKKMNGITSSVNENHKAAI